MSVLVLIATLVAAGAAGFLLPRLVAERLELQVRAHRRKLELEDVLRDPVLCFSVFMAAGLVFAALTSVWVAPVALVAAIILSRRAPHMLDKRRRDDLRRACDRQLDTLADIVAMGMRGGLSFDAALALYCEKFPGELSQVMGSAQLKWKSGVATRERALKDAADQVGSQLVQRFSDTVVQAMGYGSPLAGMLTTLACDIRRERFAQIERQVEKVPIKMLVPTGTCILPAMLVLIMGPVLIQFIGSSF